jgi:deoxycytidine triphosphate deaminase
MADFEQLIASPGFLTDRQISAALNAGFLLDPETWIPKSVRHASYTLRLGEKIELARAASAATSETKEFSVIRLSDGGSISLNPGDTALLFSLEHVRLPTSVLGFTVARGVLFAEALCPENTYVDPGFSGPLYTTVTNVSNRIVHLQYGMPLARLFFFKLSEPAENGYRAGSALGIAQQLTSIKAVALSTPAACEQATTRDLLSIVGAMPMGGMQLAEVLRRHGRRQAQLFTLAIGLPILLILANNSTWLRDNIGTFTANVAASLLATGLALLIPKALSKLRHS